MFRAEAKPLWTRLRPLLCSSISAMAVQRAEGSGKFPNPSAASKNRLRASFFRFTGGSSTGSSSAVEEREARGTTASVSVSVSEATARPEEDDVGDVVDDTNDDEVAVEAIDEEDEDEEEEEHEV